MPSRTPTSPRGNDPRAHNAEEAAEEAARAPRSGSRGPLLLFAVGALLAVVVATAQFLHMPIPGLQFLPGGRNSAAASGDQRAAKPGDPVFHDLSQFRKEFGDPKQATYGRISIPSINVDAPLSKGTVGKDGQLPDPLGPTDVMWYDFGSRKDVGGVPGAGRNAILAGHVDRAGFVDYAGVEYSGPGILFWLDRLAAGDIIEVTANGKTLRYGVVWAKQVPADADWNQLFSSEVLGDSITIVTCGGDFDYTKHEYNSRYVVRAVRG